jgi:hypothetical protein
MPKYVYIQIHGAEKPARIKADKVEHKKAEDSHIVGDYILSLSLGETKGGIQGTCRGWLVDSGRVVNRERRYDGIGMKPA